MSAIAHAARVESARSSVALLALYKSGFFYVLSYIERAHSQLRQANSLYTLL